MVGIHDDRNGDQRRYHQFDGPRDWSIKHMRSTLEQKSMPSLYYESLYRSSIITKREHGDRSNQNVNIRANAIVERAGKIFTEGHRMASPKPELPFPPVTKRHILNCSYHAWHPRYRTLTPKSRVIPLPKAFVDYLRADGIILPPEPQPQNGNAQTTADDDGEAHEEAAEDPSQAWPDTHATIISTIADLGGCITPKLNWSAPKDATWINPTNSIDCRSANDVYMMLKSSDFVTHDLEHAFDGCVDAQSDSDTDAEEIPYHLVLRKYVPQWNPSLEFRCFVRDRTLLGLCQRDLNHYDFLFDLRPKIISLVRAFFDKELEDSFPDGSFVFDVYVPQPYNRVWLVDINPWAIRTDPILFSWMELLTMGEPVGDGGIEELDGDGEETDGANFVRLPLRTGAAVANGVGGAGIPAMPPTPEESASEEETEEEDAVGGGVLQPRSLELRLITKNDPEGYSFSMPQYSAHKLPRDVVDASAGNYDAEQLKDFSQKWQELVQQGQTQRDGEADSDDD